jgi:tripartite ATP-independent transporter DctM subunit
MAGLIVGFFVLVLLSGSAIAYLIGASTVIAFLLTGNGEFLAALPQRVLSQLDVFAFMAMPLFILVGDLMNRGGVATALIDLAMSLMGRLKGGLGHVNILTSMFFAGVSGSATADAAAMSNTLVPAMLKRGYSLEYAAAVTAASSVVGPVIPPSVILIFYGAIMGVSVTALFVAAIVPGVLLGITLLLVNGVIAHKEDHPGGANITLPPLLPSIYRALPAISLPLIILGGVIFGLMTPTESAAVAVFASIGAGFFYGQMSWSVIRGSLERTLKLSGALFLILCAIASLSYLLSIERIPQTLAAFVETSQLSLIGYWLTVNLIFLVAGMVMDIKAAAALLAPVFVPIGLAMGIDPVHLGIVLCFNLALGLLTPPLGIVLVVISAVTRVSYWRLVAAVLPFLVAELFILVLLVLVPDLSLYLPGLLGFLGEP